MLTADGTNLCATNQGSIVLPNGTYVCFIGFEATPGTTYPINTPELIPFEQATVVNPAGVTIVQGGVITSEGTDLCAENPGSVVFTDGRYPCTRVASCRSSPVIVPDRWEPSRKAEL